MAGPKSKPNKRHKKSLWLTVTTLIQQYCNRTFLTQILTDPKYTNVVAWLLLVVELFLNLAIIARVNYTEIDWKAYMQECEGFLNGTLDYTKLKGDTGPLVYPAGFVYIYSALYYITSYGTNIRLGQYIFLALYLAQLYLTFRIYERTKKVPPYSLVLVTLTSYRIHSIYVLRLFNDPVAVLLLYASLNLFLSSRWWLASVVYSLAVSVKMNILLYAPCLLIAYLINLSLKDTVGHLGLCALVQVVLGAPFLYTNFLGYIQGSFDLRRVFEYRWTVNYRFLARDTFENRWFHLSLLMLHAIVLLAFLPLIRRYLTSYRNLKQVERNLKTELHPKKSDNDAKLAVNFDATSQLFVLPFFVTNLIGVACARSLHYQFYAWYFHSLLYLVYCTRFSRPVMFLTLAVIEYCWNCYPSTSFSSIALHFCHGLLLVGIYRTMKNITS